MQRAIFIVIGAALVGCGPPDRGPGSDDDDCTGLVLACAPEAGRATPVTGMGTGAVSGHVAAMADRYALGWYEGLGPAFVGITDARGRLETQVELSPDGLFTHIAWNGNEIGAAYVDEDAAGTRWLRFVRVDARGQIVPGSRITLESAACDDLTIAWSPVTREWAVAWEEISTDSIWLTRIDEHGAIVPGSARMLSDPERIGQLAGGGTALTWSNDVWAVVWSEIIGPARVRLARLDAAGQLLGVTTVADGFVAAYHASVAGSCEGFGIGFELDEHGSDLFVTRFVVVDRAGVRLPGEETFAFPDRHASAPNVVWTGTQYRVLYNEATPTSGALWLADIAPGGGSQSRMLVAESWSPHAIWDGCRVVVAYQEPRRQEYGHLLFQP